MSGFIDRMDLGYFPLQDHAIGDGTPVSARKCIAGGRLVHIPKPHQGETGMMLYGAENGMGTLGDVHPWFFWQVRDRAVRGNGAWSQAFGSMYTDADGYYARAW